ncbi:MAG: hypothetical protein PHE99_00995 [Bacteroidales bacterium]|nr:hypothetical protein [Bacteroidales bacterium]
MRTAKIILTLTTAIMIVTGCDWVRSQLGMATSQEIEALKIEQQRVEAGLQKADSIEKARLDSIKLVADSLEMEKAIEKKKLESRERFHVILGSFKNYSNSARMVEKLTKKGYKPQVFNFKNGFEAVSICSFDKVTPAFNEMYNLLDQGFAPDDIWVYDIKQNLHN